MGRMWMTRRRQFPISGTGSGITGWDVPTSPAARENYRLTAAINRRLPTVYDALRYLEQQGYGTGPGNLHLGLRSFMSSYDRWPAMVDSQLIDCITALEAVLGSKTESTFRLAFRVAGLLGADDTHRAEVFRAMKAFYNVRSRYVHGDEPTRREHAVLEHVGALKGYVRLLLTAFVVHAAQPQPKYPSAYFKESLDEALMSASEREQLRVALGLAGRADSEGEATR